MCVVCFMRVVILMGLCKLFCFKENTRYFRFEKVQEKNQQLEKDTRFFNSASVLLNFFTNRASNVTYVLLNKYKHCHTETLFIFSVFLSMSRTRSINVVSL